MFPALGLTYLNTDETALSFDPSLDIPTVATCALQSSRRRRTETIHYSVHTFPTPHGVISSAEVLLSRSDAVRGTIETIYLPGSSRPRDV